MPSADPLVARMRGFGTTIFAEMSALAVTTRSVNLGQGFPDTDGPAELLAAAADAIRTGHNQYPPGAGVPELRRAIAAHQKRCYALDYDPDAEVLVTAGATEAIAAAVLALAGPGDEVVLFEPYYDSYTACIALAGAQRRVVPLARDGGGWAFDPDALTAAITPRTKVLLLNSPHNPTGKVFDAAELRAVAEAAVANDLIVVSDEVYEHLTFDGRPHVPIATLPGMRERTVTIGSAGKTFSVTGWKIGWACAPPRLVGAVRTVKQFLTYVNGAPFQPALAQALDAESYRGMAAELQQRRDQLCDGLDRLGFDVVRPEATYFATVDVHSNAVEFCRELPRRAGVVAIPSSVFYDSAAGDSLVRFAFCKQPHVLAEALRRLEEAAP
ncbi:MAG: N-succinyldiaminopimelate aminotransferase [Pseudonocardiales bacterium]|nr:N-succinyldiaminopimelate aminotransferase [Pseudonocardiales bacterium]